MTFCNHIKKYFFLIILLSLISCNKTNWNENYREKSKSPFGTYIIYNEAKDLFNNNEVHYLKENIYDYLDKKYSNYDNNFGNYICIKNNASKLTKNGLDDLLEFVNNGDNAFLSLNYFSKTLKDSLQFSTKNLDSLSFMPFNLKSLKGELFLENKTFNKKSFKFNRNIRRNYFDSINKKNTIVLGTINVDGKKQPNFIKIYHGKGAVYLHTNPVVFTNYFMLNGKEEYATKLLSYLPDANIIWDSQIKSSKYSNKPNENKDSIFKFFLKHPTLKWFLLVSFIGLLLFITFNARRKQRPIPIIEPLKNSTVQFAHTIANLYLKEEDHKNLVDKKTKYFLEKIRTKYLINTSNLNKDFIEKLAAKSGNDLQNTKYLINTITTLNNKAECSEEELIVLNKMIEKFLNK